MQPGVGRARAVAEDQAVDAPGDQLLDDRVERRRRPAPPRERGEPVRTGVEADREPVAGDREAAGQRLRPLDDRDREDDPRRAGGERQAHVVGLLEATRDLERHRDPRRDRADGLEVGGRRALGPVEVDEVQDPGALGDELLGDPVGTVGGHADAGGGAGPVHDPRPSGLDVDRRDHVHRRQPSARSRRRWKLIGSEPLRSSVSWKARSEKSAPRRRRSSSRRPRISTLPSR